MLIYLYIYIYMKEEDDGTVRLMESEETQGIYSGEGKSQKALVTLSP